MQVIKQKSTDLSYWIDLQQQATRNGGKAKIYYTATSNGITPYKYVETIGNKKTIIIIEKGETK